MSKRANSACLWRARLLIVVLGGRRVGRLAGNVIGLARPRPSVQRPTALRTKRTVDIALPGRFLTAHRASDCSHNSSPEDRGKDALQRRGWWVDSLGRKSGRPDLNRRRPAWEAGILPLNYARSGLSSAPPPDKAGRATVKKKTPASSYSPTACRCSTIGAGGLNGRVRDGNGCGPSAIETGEVFQPFLIPTSPQSVKPPARPGESCARVG